MTSKDKTRNKLVASLRKTRETVEDDSTAAKPAGTAASEKPSAASRKSSESDSAPTPARTIRSSSSLANQDPFQSGRRVWPD